jgi:catechol 2,3-dioxygenase-like lactoylglutathione lyase family enzyme
MVGVRYIVDDVAAAVAFYTEQLGFTVAMFPAPEFAALDRGELRLFLSAPCGPGGGARAAVDGSMPAPGGWNRIQLVVDDVAVEADRLRAAGVPLRVEVQVGMAGSQVVVEDPSGNPVELFEWADQPSG